MQREREEARARQEQMIRQQQEEAMAMRRRQDEMRLQQDSMRRRGGNDDMGGNRDQVGVLNLCHCKGIGALSSIAPISFSFFPPIKETDFTFLRATIPLTHCMLISKVS